MIPTQQLRHALDNLAPHFRHMFKSKVAASSAIEKLAEQFRHLNEAEITETVSVLTDIVTTWADIPPPEPTQKLTRRARYIRRYKRIGRGLTRKPKAL